MVESYMFEGLDFVKFFVIPLQSILHTIIKTHSIYKKTKKNLSFKNYIFYEKWGQIGYLPSFHLVSVFVHQPTHISTIDI